MYETGSILEVLIDNQLDWVALINALSKMGFAFVLSLPIAWNRERASRSMGMRTFPLVAVASCGYALLGIEGMQASTEAQARIVQGLITGMGFIGGGAILKMEDRVVGTATAAALWSTGIIGVSCAQGYFVIAIAVSLIGFLTLSLMAPLKSEMREVLDSKVDPRAKHVVSPAQ